MTLSVLFERARRLARQYHFSVIPLDHPQASTQADPRKRGKVPALASWKQYQRRHPTDPELETWFSKSLHNIGIVTGEVSGIVVVDADDSTADAWATAHLPPTPMKVRTAQGMHRYYRHPGVAVRNRARIRTDEARLHLDLRGEGGYVCGPGSLHASGIIYQAPEKWPAVIDGVPPFDPHWLEPPPARDPLAQARRYLAHIPPAIEHEGGDTHTFNVAAKLVRGFALSDSDALDLLLDWNQRCQPPWTREELEVKVRNARSYANEPIGGRLRDEPDEHQAEPPGRIFACSDLGNAEYFADRYAGQLRFDHRRRHWLRWAAPVWAVDQDAHVLRLARLIVRERQEAAWRMPHHSEEAERARMTAIRWTLGSESLARLHALVTLAQSDRQLADAGEHWDADPMLLACQNGAVDLRTGRLRAAQPAERLMLQTAVAYDADARCPRWEQALAEICNGDEALLAFLHRALGYSLTGDTYEQVIFWLYGPGSNGKSTVINTVRQVVGSYGWNLPFTTLELARGTVAPPTDLPHLAGRRFVSSAEMTDGARLNAGRLKALTGGDPITARHFYGDFFSFVPVCKLWLATNAKPIVHDDSEGFWRRMRLIPFVNQFPPNPALDAELRTESPGILAWLVRGCRLWQADGLQTPPAVDERTDQYRKDSDPLAEFLRVGTEPSPEEKIRASELYQHYVRWAKSEGFAEREILTSTMFGRLMGERYSKSREAAGISYVDLALKGFFVP